MLSSITVPVQYLRDKESNALRHLSDGDVEQLKIEQARRMAATDIALCLGFSSEADVPVDALDGKEESLYELIAAAQLFWYFSDNNNGVGSLTHAKMQFYQEQYQFAVERLPALLRSGIRSDVVIIQR